MLGSTEMLISTIENSRTVSLQSYCKCGCGFWDINERNGDK